MSPKKIIIKISKVLKRILFVSKPVLALQCPKVNISQAPLWVILVPRMVIRFACIGYHIGRN